MHLGQNCLGLGGVARLSGEGLRTLASLAENTDLTASFLQAIWAVLLKVVTAVIRQHFRMVTQCSVVLKA